MPPQTVRVRGYRETMRALARADKESRRAVQGEFRRVGEIVTKEWAFRFRDVDAKSAAGLRTRVRQGGVSAEQSKRRTTGQHPEFGAMQMRYGARVLADKESEIVEGFDDALDRVADHFDRG